jgi:hypothetical protein
MDTIKFHEVKPAIEEFITQLKPTTTTLIKLTLSKNTTNIDRSYEC